MALSSAIIDSKQLQVELKNRRIQTYQVEDSGLSLHACISNVNRNNFQGYGSDYTQGAGAQKIVVGCLQQYYDLIKSLAACPRIRFAPHCDLMTQPVSDDEIVCSIRHDVDADPRVSLAEAEIEAEFNASSTYFILHTATYYGAFQNGIFRRNSCMAVIYRKIQELGQEIALHTDPLELFQNLNINGAEAIVTEVEWLRSQGLRIVGSVAHNSAPIYGVENYAIFKGRNKHDKSSNADSHTEPEYLDEVIHQGRWAPLGIVDEGKLGLHYEGNEFLHQRTVPVEYGATRGVNRWRWNQHNLRLKNCPNPKEDLFIDQTRLLRDIQTMPGGRWLILNVHPLYYGARHNETTAPPMHVDSITVDQKSSMGWDTYTPNTLQARSGNEHDAQVINFSDEDGMLDAPCLKPDADNTLRIMFLGGANLDGLSTPIPEHCGQQLYRLLARHLKRSIWCRTLAFPSMGLCRHFDWFTRHNTTVSPDLVLIGIGADEIETSVTPNWCLNTGFDSTFPPASYLKANGHGVEVVAGAPKQAAIRRSQAQAKANTVSLTNFDSNKHSQANDQIAHCVKYYADAVRATGAVPMLLVNECGESAGLWNEGVTSDRRVEGHAQALSYIKQWGSHADVPIIDPYAAFLTQNEDLICHVTNGKEWNATGHRLAAGVLFDAVVDFLSSHD